MKYHYPTINNRNSVKNAHVYFTNSHLSLFCITERCVVEKCMCACFMGSVSNYSQQQSIQTNHSKEEKNSKYRLTEIEYNADDDYYDWKRCKITLKGFPYQLLQFISSFIMIIITQYKIVTSICSRIVSSTLHLQPRWSE